jgi:hypothetical protein
MRTISEKFVRDLKNPDGLLNPILESVKRDHTLMLAIRDHYINIYYRGGNILKATEQGDGSYKTFFDKDYDKSGKTIIVLPEILKTEENVRTWIDEFPHLKKIVDVYFSNKGKPEREFQQLVARENNNSTISNESEYFISDIEFNDEELGARLDMLAIRWLASDRKDGSRSRPAFIEMKYGDTALGGNAGILKHLQDFDKLISNRDKYTLLLNTMESQFNQLHELGLLHFKQSKETKVKLVSGDKPEVIFILSNHNPRSNQLTELLENHEFSRFGTDEDFYLRFFVSSFAGYGLHSNCMFSLTEFRTFLKILSPSQKIEQDSKK